MAGQAVAAQTLRLRDQAFDGTLLQQSRAALRVTLSRDLPRAILGAWFWSHRPRDFAAFRPRMI